MLGVDNTFATPYLQIPLDLGAGLEAAKVTPSGRGQTAPVELGKTAEVRQRNRRTEIILTPKLDELFQILETN